MGFLRSSVSGGVKCSVVSHDNLVTMQLYAGSNISVNSYNRMLIIVN